jgi:hypothetical protein
VSSKILTKSSKRSPMNIFRPAMRCNRSRHASSTSGAAAPSNASSSSGKVPSCTTSSPTARAAAASLRPALEVVTTSAFRLVVKAHDLVAKPRRQRFVPEEVVDLHQGHPTSRPKTLAPACQDGFQVGKVRRHEARPQTIDVAESIRSEVMEFQVYEANARMVDPRGRQ